MPANRTARLVFPIVRRDYSAYVANSAENTADFTQAVREMQEAVVHPAVTVRDTDAPAALAPEALALAATARLPHSGDSLDPVAEGRLVLLRDPERVSDWGGQWRIVVFVQTDVEPAIATDPMATDVVWAWLVDSLADAGAAASALSGTATVTTSRGYGGLAENGEHAHLELRASWTPLAPFGPHMSAWTALTGMMAGLPTEGVSVHAAAES